MFFHVPDFVQPEGIHMGKRMYIPGPILQIRNGLQIL